jgi:hypothetical protein
VADIGSSRGSVVVSQHAAQSLTALDVTTTPADAILRFDQHVAETLVVPLDMVMLGELTDGTMTTLSVGEPEPLSAKLFLEDSVLLAQVLNRRLLMLDDPPRKNGEEELPRL